MSCKTLFLSLCVALIALNAVQAQKSIPKRFVVITKSASFFEAWHDCNSFDGYLAAIESARDQSLVDEALAKSSNPNGVYFIGGTDIGRDGRWMWIGLNKQLKDTDYRNFYPGEPNNLGGRQECLTVGNWKGEQRGKWDDSECDKKLDGYVCAFPARPK
ncbi:ladderlectin-like [Anopheles stephensi]|uniref:C-type lectin domain-containing protein n=1 Tax=Anopheles stephensi TaxID=30069 RepID=A0A182XV34_ANOST|nr:ladderlectin-like [Anopheles stephensi]